MQVEDTYPASLPHYDKEQVVSLTAKLSRDFDLFKQHNKNIGIGGSRSNLLYGRGKRQTVGVGAAITDLNNDNSSTFGGHESSNP